jgi:iron-sulfur cluster repair protein YtfE (RIC family)
MTANQYFNRQNEKLHSGIAEVARLRDQLGQLTPERVREGLDHALAFFRHEVGPHARAEERVFYPAVARILDVDLGSRLVGEHRYIDSLVSDVTEIRHRIATDGMVPTDLHGALTALVDTVESHLRLEEEVLRRMLARNLGDREAYLLSESMVQAEATAAAEMSAPHH